MPCSFLCLCGTCVKCAASAKRLPNDSVNFELHQIPGSLPIRSVRFFLKFGLIYSMNFGLSAVIYSILDRVFVSPRHPRHFITSLRAVKVCEFDRIPWKFVSTAGFRWTLSLPLHNVKARNLDLSNNNHMIARILACHPILRVKTDGHSHQGHSHRSDALNGAAN